MKTSHIIGYILLGLIVLLALVFAFWYGEKSGYEMALNDFDPAEEPQAAVDPACKGKIQEGSRGEEVVAFQIWYNMNRPGFTKKIKEDGIFGAQTRAAADNFRLPNCISSLDYLKLSVK